jgi:hypothetical protein
MSISSESSVIYYPGYSQVQVRENLVVRSIASITQGFPAVVTTTVDHEYVSGMDVTFQISPQFGMTQLNGLDIQVLSVTNNSLSINIDTSNFTPFAYPSPLPNAYTLPSVIPNSSGKYLPPLPLPYGNQNSFEGVIFNDGVV